MVELNEEFDIFQEKPSKKWLRERRQTLIIFYMESFLISLQYPLFLLTSWIYVDSLIVTLHPKLIYCFINFAYMLSTSLLPQILKKFTKYCRNVWILFFLVNTVTMAGNMMYTLHQFPILIIMGRFFGASCEALKPIISQEISLCYNIEQQSTIYFWLGIIYNFGIFAAAILNFGFLSIHFTVAAWQIQGVNFVGMFMTFLFFLVQIAACFLIHNCSKEYNVLEQVNKLLLQHEQNVERRRYNGYANEKYYCLSINGNNSTSSDSLSEDTPLIWTRSLSRNERMQLKHFFEKFTKLLNDIDRLLILFFSFFVWFFISSFDILLPVYVTEFIHWNLKNLNIIVALLGLAIFLGLFVFSLKSYSGGQLFYCFVISILFMYLTCCVLWLMAKYGYYSHCIYYVGLAFVILFFSFICLNMETFLIVASSNMVSSDLLQLFSNIRYNFSRSGSLVACLVPLLLYDSIVTLAIVLSVVLFIGLALVLWRFRYLKDVISTKNEEKKTVSVFV